LNKSGDNALHYACRLGKDKLIKTFANSGQFDINETNNDGDAPLHIAVDCGCIEVVRQLIVLGAKVNCQNKKFKTPLILATELISPYDMNIFDLLVSHGACVDSHTNNGNCALLSASKFGNFDLIRILIDLKANLNLKFHDGTTALMRASYYNYANIVGILLEHGASVNDTNKRNETPVYIASFRGNYDIVRVLIDHGANIDLEDIDGDTPLAVACYENRTNVISLLLKNNASVNKQVNLRGF
jgi:ankyrin repeat protein